MSRTDPSRRTGLVLAGGGAKGAFELGALEHLIGVERIEPQVITSTSAGSILGVVLAQARGLVELDRAVEDLRADLLAMTRTDMVFARQQWLAEMSGTPVEAMVDSAITDRTRPPIPGGPLDHLDAHERPGRWQRFRDAVRSVPAANRARKAWPHSSSSVLTFDPLEAAMRGHADVGIRPVGLSMIQRPGVELRMSVTAMNAAELHYVCGDGSIVGPDARTEIRAAGNGVDAIDGALASSSVPMVFQPRKLGHEVYADGGCLVNVPVRAALQLDADDLYAVLAIPIHPPRVELDFTRQDLISVFMRATADVAFVQRQKDDLAVPLPDGTTMRVIAPTLDVVGPFEVQQGLLLIDVDYGRLRAEEIMSPIGTEERERAQVASDAVTTARVRAWHLEQLMRADPTDRRGRARSHRRLLDTVTAALADRARTGLSDPAGSQQWSQPAQM